MSSEITGRTDLLFKNIDRLEEIAFFMLRNPKEKGYRDASGNVLRTLSEFKIRKICGEVLYRAGVQSYAEISEKKFARDTLSGKIDARDRNKIQSYQLNITLERKDSRSKIHTFGECQCALAKEGNLCPHIAALMISWVKKPQEFQEDLLYLKSDFAKARKNVLDSLEELLDSIENSSSAQVLDSLQDTYSRIRSCGNNIREVNRDLARSKFFDPIREFSGTINYVSLAIVSAIECKYPKIKAIDVYNKATLTTFGKVLELFVENTEHESKSTPVKKDRKTSNTTTTRSWDVLVESFTKES